MRRSFARNFALFRRAVCFSAFIFSLLAAVSFADEPVKTAAEEMATETAFDFGAEPVRYIENDRLKVGFDLSIVHRSERRTTRAGMGRARLEPDSVGRLRREQV